MLEILYGLASAISLAAYLPTVFELTKGEPSASIRSYLLWSLGSSISLLYVVIKIQDVLMLWVYGAHLFLCVLILTLRIRLKVKAK